MLPLRFATLEPDRELDVGRLVEPPPRYRPANPSIVQFGGRRIVSVRCVNYTLANERSLEARFASGTHWHSVNRFLAFGDLVGKPVPLGALDPLFDGVEDLRLIVVDGRLHAVGSMPDAQGHGGGCAMVLFAMSEGLDAVERIALPSPFGLPHEKNWAPFVHEGALHFVYSLDPLVILRRDPATGTLDRVVGGDVEPAELNFLLSGSSQGVPHEGGWLFVFHKRSVRLRPSPPFPPPARGVIYVHYLVWLSQDLKTVRRSRAFVIGRPAIHFVGGMATSAGRITMSYGRADRSARLADFDRRALLRWAGFEG